MTDPFTISRAVRERHFVQVPLLNLSQFRTLVKERGLSELTLLSTPPWETLDREGLVPPVAYALHGFAWGHEEEHYLDAGDLLIRAEVGYRPWDELRAEAAEKHETDLWILYHRWQVFRYAEILRQLDASTPYGNLGDGLESFYAARAKIATVEEPPREWLRDAAASYEPHELALVRAQDYFYPREAGNVWKSGSLLGLTDDQYEFSQDRGRGTDWAAAAAECGLDADGLKGLHESFAFSAQRLDPNERLLVLMDQLQNASRERLRGDALRALDYYRAARVVGRWYRAITGEPLPDVDEYTDLGGGSWKERFYGTRDLRGNREALPAILDHHGLYPYRVQLVGEGESELEALSEILQYGYGLSFARLGIIPVDIGGADPPEGADRLLAALRVYANYLLLVFDNEGRAAALVDELRRRGVVEGVSAQQRAKALSDAMEGLREQIFESDAARQAAMRDARQRAQRLEHEPGAAPEFLLWRENLEADNFSNDELCEVVNVAAREGGVELFDLTPDQLSAALAEGDRAVASVLVELAEDAEPPFRLTKPELARRLARYAVDRPQRDGQERPLLLLAEHLIRLAGASRMLRNQLRS